MQEAYESIPGQTKITFLLQAMRNTAAAEEVRLNLTTVTVMLQFREITFHFGILCLNMLNLYII